MKPSVIIELRRSKLSAGAKVLAWTIDSLSGDQAVALDGARWCFASNPYLAKECGVSATVTKRRLDELREGGWIEERTGHEVPDEVRRRTHGATLRRLTGGRQQGVPGVASMSPGNPPLPGAGNPPLPGAGNPPLPGAGNPPLPQLWNDSGAKLDQKRDQLARPRAREDADRAHGSERSTKRQRAQADLDELLSSRSPKLAERLRQVIAASIQPNKPWLWSAVLERSAALPDRLVHAAIDEHEEHSGRTAHYLGECLSTKAEEHRASAPVVALAPPRPAPASAPAPVAPRPTVVGFDPSGDLAAQLDAMLARPREVRR